MSAECSKMEMIDLIPLHLLTCRLGIKLCKAKLFWVLLLVLMHEVAALGCFHFSKNLILEMLKNCGFWKNFLFRAILCWIKHDFMSGFGQSHFMCFGNEKKNNKRF